MRLSLLLVLSLTTGCAVGTPDSFDYQSTLSRDARGLVLHEDGLRGHAGMMGTNCPFETQGGSVTGDYQLPGVGEKVVDSGDLIGEDTVLLTLGDDLHLLDKSTGEYSHQTVNLPGLRDGRLFDGGIVALTEQDGACQVHWSEAGEGVSAPCGSLDADPMTGQAVISHVRGVSLVDRTGATLLADAGALAVLDHVAEAIYTADGSAVRTLELDGTLRWEARVEGEVLALAEAGATGAAAVFVGHSDGTGELLYLDGDSGVVQASVQTPSVADELTVSADGSTVAVTRQSAAHFFRLRDEWRD